MAAHVSVLSEIVGTTQATLAVDVAAHFSVVVEYDMEGCVSRYSLYYKCRLIFDVAFKDDLCVATLQKS